MTNPQDDSEVGELDVADYIVLLLAWDTYFRYLKETSESDPTDPLLLKGVQLIKFAETQSGAAYHKFLDESLPTPAHKKMLERAWKFLLNREGLPRRALQIRTLLSRGGAGTMRKVFKTNKALQHVRAALGAAMVQDADAALDLFAVIAVRNMRIRNWIDQAAESAGSGTFQSPVAAGGKQSVDDTSEILSARVQQAASSPTSQQSTTSNKLHEEILVKVQTEAQEAAKQALTVIGEADEPPTKSEVIGIATAAAVQAMTDPENDRNIDPELVRLDPEQRAAALTDGRVLVSAGAGAGKSTTLVARIAYLVKSRKVNPAKILACSFNKKAAAQLKEKIAKTLGYNAASTTGVQVGTMHALFYKFIVGDRQMPGFGNAEEQAMLKPPRLIAPSKKGVKSISPVSLTTAIRGMWNECDPKVLAGLVPGADPKWFEGGPPKAKKVGLLLNVWRGNNVSLDEAKTKGTDKATAQAAVWYELYMGVKGDIPGWRPPCGNSNSLDRFMAKNRPGKERLGDLDDMLKVFLDILKRDAKARTTIQGMFEHMLVDESQDSNYVQHAIFELMSEHVDAKKGTSIWMIGDPKQALYSFRGARPELFQALDGKPGWTTKNIRTNYRCEPEIVDAANRLIVNNGPMTVEAVPSPKKDRGRASILVDTPADNTEAALNTIGRVRKDMDTEGAQPEDYAVLARTNAELNNFQAACIINEIPYIRRGGKGFLEAPESKAVLGCLDLVSGSNYEKMRDSLVAVLMKPDRGLYLGHEDVAKAVDEAIDDIARRERVDVKSVRPSMLLQSPYVRTLADRLKQPYRLKIINSAKGDARKGEWMYGKRVEELMDNLQGLNTTLRDIEDMVKLNVPTDQLMTFILDNVTSVVGNWDPATRRVVTTTTSLREQITNDLATFSDEGDDSDDDAEPESQEKPEIGEDGLPIAPKKDKADEAKGLGAVQFLYALMNPNPNDQTNNTDPSTAQGFVDKLARYSKLAESLRIDPDKWEKEQQKIADPGQRREKPPAITLSTVHSMKGAEFKNVSVLMPKGIFPMERKPKPDEPPPDPVEEAERIRMERNLAYVAMTRAISNLEILCPEDTGVSRFVIEAGLAPGENVKKSVETVENVKTASAEYDDYVAETIAMYNSQAPEVISYERTIYQRGN